MARGRHSEIQKTAITRIVQPHLKKKVHNGDNLKIKIQKVTITRNGQPSLFPLQHHQGDGHHVDKDDSGHGNDDDNDENVVSQNNDNHQRASRFSSAPRRGTGRRSNGAEILLSIKKSILGYDLHNIVY